MSANNKPNLAVVLSRFPFPLEKGDKLRAFYQIKEMSQHFNIFLMCISESKPKSEHIHQLEEFCSEISIHVIPKWKSWLSCLIALFTGTPLQIAYFYSFNIRRKIEKKLVEIKPNHIFCQLIRVSEYVKNYHDCPKTLDYMDAFSTGIERRVKLEPFYLKWLFKMEYRRLMEYERQIYDYFEIHTIISEQDKKLLGTTPAQKIICIPNGVSQQFFQTKNIANPKYDLVFVGNLSYPPNVEAVKYVVKEILSLADKKGIQLSFLAAGAQPMKSLIQLEKQLKNFDILANPEDIRDAYLAGKIFVAPMKIGTGLQNKLLESMALGIPSITTSLANNALNAKPDFEILIAESAEEFLNQILSLENSDRYKMLSKNGSEFIRHTFDWTATTQPLIFAIKNA
jgi:glycosyltransferase involved in cell wall biosynthesis